MIDAYRGFFAASAGASAAFIGLLFVAISLIDGEKTNQKDAAWRQIVANSSFTQLINVFFVSLAGLLPSPYAVALTGCIMAVIGLIVSISLLSPTMDSDRTGRTTPTVLGIAAFGVYALELITAFGLLHNPNSQTLLDFFILSILLLYAGGLARAWGITGIKNH